MVALVQRTGRMRITFAVVAYVLTLALMCSGMAANRQHHGAASAISAPCAEHHHHAASHGDQQHDPAQNDACCFGLGCHCAPSLGTPPKTASVTRISFRVATFRPPLVMAPVPR